jgi:hypothetical protein
MQARNSGMDSFWGHFRQSYAVPGVQARDGDRSGQGAAQVPWSVREDGSKHGVSATGSWSEALTRSTGANETTTRKDRARAHRDRAGGPGGGTRVIVSAADQSTASGAAFARNEAAAPGQHHPPLGQQGRLVKAQRHSSDSTMPHPTDSLPRTMEEPGNRGTLARPHQSLSSGSG